MAAENCLVFMSSLMFIFKTDALMCYQCGDSSITGKCLTDTATMEAEYYKYNATQDPTVSDSTKKEPYTYIKECIDGADACVIEKIEEQGQMHAYIRDCYNTTTDKLSMPDARFENLDNSRNQSSCIYDSSSKRLFCVTFCTGDLCNGPQIESAATITKAHLSLGLTFTLSLVSVVVNPYSRFSLSF